jgi:hypothetical protein
MNYGSLNNGGGGAIEYPGYSPDTQSLFQANGNGLPLRVVDLLVAVSLVHVHTLMDQNSEVLHFRFEMAERKQAKKP